MTTGILRKDFQTGYFAKKQMVQNGAGGEPLSGLGEIASNPNGSHQEFMVVYQFLKGKIAP